MVRSLSERLLRFRVDPEGRSERNQADWSTVGTKDTTFRFWPREVRGMSWWLGWFSQEFEVRTGLKNCFGGVESRTRVFVFIDL